MSNPTKFIGPLAGIPFILAGVVGLNVSGGVDIDPARSGNTVLAEFAENSDDIKLGAYLGMFGVGFLLIFFGHLRSRIRDGGATWAADGLMAGGIVLAVAMIIRAAAEITGAEAGDYGHTEVARGAADFLWVGALIFTPGLLAIGISAAVASLAHRVLPVWLGAFALLVALGAVMPWVGVVVFVGWVLAASIYELVVAFRPEAPVITPTTSEGAGASPSDPSARPGADLRS